MKKVILITLTILLLGILLIGITSAKEEKAINSTSTNNQENLLNKEYSVKEANDLVGIKVKKPKKLPRNFTEDGLRVFQPPEGAIDDSEKIKKFSRAVMYFKDKDKNYISLTQTNHKVVPRSGEQNSKLEISNFNVGDLQVFTYSCDCGNTKKPTVVYYWYEGETSFFVDTVGITRKQAIEFINSLE